MKHKGFSHIGLSTLDLDKAHASIYFKVPNGISLEYCCIVGELPDGNEMMPGQFTVPLAALQLTDTLSKARSTGDRAKRGV